MQVEIEKGNEKNSKANIDLSLLDLITEGKTDMSFYL